MFVKNNHYQTSMLERELSRFVQSPNLYKSSGQNHRYG